MDNPIKDYLRIAKDLETTRYTQYRIAQNLQQRIQQLGIAKNYNLNISVTPSDEYKEKYKAKYFKIGFWLILCASLLFCVFGGVIASASHLVGAICLCVIAGLFYAALLALIPRAIGGMIGHKKDVAVARERSLDKHADVMAMALRDSKRVENENEMKKRLQNQLALIKEEYARTSKTLESVYEINVIHPKYRNFVAISSFYEYFETGRCSTLEGHEGAYNIFEQEARLDRIITKLDVVISKLDEIKNNQYILHQSIMQAHATLNRISNMNNVMLNSLQSIQANTELIGYNTLCANQRAEAIADMMVIQQLLK